MKFLKLEMLNLASLDKREGEVINFEEGALGESTIFSIVGPTGSGKSTILDAICLALYNRAPRYPRKKNDKGKIEIYGDADADENSRLAPTDGRNILSRGKKTGYSKLTFQANNGDIYRAEWHVQKARVKYAEALTLLYKIRRKDNGWEEESASWSSLPDVIGLDYDQFLRTVLIAQGSFANFLTAKENERYELLEKLVGCEDMYTRIADEIKKKKETAETSYNKIKTQLAFYEKDDLTPEQLEELKRRISELEEEETKWKAEWEQVKKSLEWYTTEKKITDNIALYEEAVKRAKAAWEAIREKVGRLALHDATLEAVEHYKEWKAKEQSVARIDTELDALKKEVANRKLSIEKEDKELLQLKDTVMQVEKVWEQQKPRINRARSLKVELDEAKKQVGEKLVAKNDASKNFQKATETLEENRKQIERFRKMQQEAEGKLENFKKTFAEKKEAWEAAVLQATSLYQQEEKKLEGKQPEELQAAKDKVMDTKQDLENALRVLNTRKEKEEEQETKLKDKVRLEYENGEIQKELEKLSIGVLTEEIETLQKVHTLMTSENWGIHRRSLEEGKPCPLCGAEHHPYQDEEVLQPIVNKLAHQLKDKQSQLEKEQKIKEAKTRKQSENQGLLASLEKAFPILEREIEKCHKEWEGINSKHPDWQADVSILQVTKESVCQEEVLAMQALKEYHEISARVKELRKEKEQKEGGQRDFISKAESRLKELEGKKTEADVALATEEGKTENLQNQKKEKECALRQAEEAWNVSCRLVKLKQEVLKAEIGDRDLDAYEQELAASKTKADEAVEKQTGQIAELKRQLEGVIGSIRTKETLRKEEQEACAVKERQLTEWLSDYNAREDRLQPLYLADIASLSEAKEPWEEIRKEKETMTNACVSAETTYINEKNLHAEHQQAKPQQEEQELVEKKAELEAKDNKELVEKKACLQRYETARMQMGAMHDQKQEAEQVLADWKAISDAIGGAEGKLLRKIAQCYTLHFLVEHANAEIRKFNNRYELVQVKNSLGIRVIDHDRADDIRDTTSLSGGETFIVSLGLALGLSALSSRNISFGNLFIDEGFGTLDPDTLSTVIDSLAMLQTSQGKKVGVISHTDTMSERITTQIRVIKNGNTGSSHIEVYP